MSFTDAESAAGRCSQYIFPGNNHLMLLTDNTTHYFLMVIIAADYVEYYYEPAVDHHRMSHSGN